MHATAMHSRCMAPIISTSKHTATYTIYLLATYQNATCLPANIKNKCALI